MNNSFKSFLKTIFFLSYTSFGGPQSHLILMRKYLVEKRNFLTHNEFDELTGFVQLLPGPSSTQLLVLIAFKKWNIQKSVLTLIIWLLPAALFMGSLSLFISSIKQYITPSTLTWLINFVLITILINAIIYGQQYLKTTLDYIQVILFTPCFVALFISPWVFPCLLLCCCSISFFTKRKSISQAYAPQQSIKKRSIIIFLLLFLILGFVSERARIEQWAHRKVFNLAENNYRFGTVFGGGNILSSMLYEQYVVREKTKYIKREEALLGMAVSQISPGPVFTYATYMGGLVFQNQGIYWQLVGAMVATIFVFTSGFLIAIFCFQLFDTLKKYSFVSRAMHGLNISICIVLIGTFLHLFINLRYFQLTHIHLFSCTYILLSIIAFQKKWLSLNALFLLTLLISISFQYFL